MPPEWQYNQYLLREARLLKLPDTDVRYSISEEYYTEKFGQFSACLSRNIISPGSERNQKISFFVKWHVAVHHGTDFQ